MHSVLRLFAFVIFVFFDKSNPRDYIILISICI